FPTAKHFTSWLGLCPQHRGSAGKIRSRHVRRGAHRAGRALRLAVQACHRAQHALGAFYRRIRARSGAGKAIVATARKLAERIYRLLKHGTCPPSPCPEHYPRRWATMRTLSPWVLPPLGHPLVARSVRSVGRASVRPLSSSLGYRLAGKFVAFFE